MDETTFSENFNEYKNDFALSMNECNIPNYNKANIFTSKGIIYSILTKLNQCFSVQEHINTFDKVRDDYQHIYYFRFT